MKKIFVAFFLSLFLVLPFQGAKALDLPGKTIDQACTQQSSTAFNIAEQQVFQVFSPTMENIDAFAVLIKAKPGTIASVRAKVYQVANGSVSAYATATNTATITDSISWNVFEINDMLIPPGIYAIRLFPAAVGDEAFWYTSSGDCYPNGYAVVGYGDRNDLDFDFVTYGKNSSSVAPSNPTEVSSNSDNSTSSNTPPKVTSSANKQSTQSKALLSNPAEQQQINQQLMDAILADYKQNNPKGIFGLGGIMGDILTWKNIGIFFGIMVFFVLGIVLLTRKKRPAEEKK